MSVVVCVCVSKDIIIESMLHTEYPKEAFSRHNGQGVHMHGGTVHLDWMGMGSISSDILCRHSRTDSRQVQGSGAIVSYCPIPFAVRGRSPMRCE